ncbi:MAG TPA: sugar kinase, partial [Alphaproteobacteria bacterium]|nr:sugar kinase [Alphaproteobacteria bacterium]
MRDTCYDAAALTGIVRRWCGRRVVVLGDLMIDEFVYGRTDRVSREAPVVVVRYDGSGFSPGGAANAAQNVAALGGRAVPVGFVGDDERGAMLRSLLSGAGVGTAGMLVFRDRFTTAKMRVMAGDYHAQRQQIVRVDREQRTEATAAEEKRILARFRREAARAAAVILSDYGQGVFSGRIVRGAIDFCRKGGIPVVADSRFRLRLFRGVTTAVPNEVEAHAAAGTTA